MAFMRPTADYFKAYEVETNEGTEIVPADALSLNDQENVESPDDWYGKLAPLYQYISASKIENVTVRKGWFSRLSADGYTDCTEWMGPFASEDEAIAEVKEAFDCDDEGNDVDA